MIVGNIEIVTILVTLMFLIPILWNIYKSEFFKRFSIVGLIGMFNKSLKIQGIIAICLIPLSWTWNKVNFIFDYIIAETTHTYIVVGIFMNLASIAFFLISSNCN